MPNPSLPEKTPSEMAADWCVRLHFEECSDADRAEFLRWYHADPAHAAEYANMCRIWQVSEQLPTLSTRTARRRALPLLARAAVVVLALGGAWSAGWAWGVLPGEVRYFAAEGQRRQVQLPDLSRVELNQRTGLLYLGYRQQRQVYLRDGEAFFDVQRDLDKPFLISADNASVRVTGTHFNVWTAPTQTTVTVSEGAVLVSHGDGGEGRNQGAELTAGLQAEMRNGRLAQLRRVDPARATAWRNGKLMLDDVSLREALPLINRYLDAPLQLDGDGVGELRVGGIYDTTELDRLVSALPQILPVTLRRDDGVIRVSPR
ncbi:FecR family protein [Pseudomonas sp. 148P]|uniref:FecR family protein n=1 Tax=Pseudomonas ulcerans TaxID=3115852 RepID=A0ABU7HYY6_9PSED|nr:MULTISPECIES: FecR family protein [unclassified Pseudomonas]MEE1925334.1 FecR family protein [Pseudomonas sp. 147P]MEE1936788.1 FecR family protein [Pseudomonas sp. 148P]